MSYKDFGVCDCSCPTFEIDGIAYPYICDPFCLIHGRLTRHHSYGCGKLPVVAEKYVSCKECLDIIKSKTTSSLWVRCGELEGRLAKVEDVVKRQAELLVKITKEN